MNRADDSLFEFYEVIEVVAGRPIIGVIVGRRGAVLGKAQNEETGAWSYSVSMLESGESWSLRENEIVSTGVHMTRRDFYDGSSVKVLSDPETGDGTLADP
jgi:hypothetical protein